MRVSALVFDLDGTLLNPNHELSSVNRDALRQAMDAGVAVWLAAGAVTANKSTTRSKNSPTSCSQFPRARSQPHFSCSQASEVPSDDDLANLGGKYLVAWVPAAERSATTTIGRPALPSPRHFFLAQFAWSFLTSSGAFGVSWSAPAGATYPRRTGFRSRSHCPFVN